MSCFSPRSIITDPNWNQRRLRARHDTSTKLTFLNKLVNLCTVLYDSFNDNRSTRRARLIYDRLKERKRNAGSSETSRRQVLINYEQIQA